VKKKPRLIKACRPEDFEKAAGKGAKALREGGIVAFPSESFYGLAVDINCKEAIERLFLVKKRKPDQPVLILIPSVKALDRYANSIPPVPRRLIETFWPGGLTLVLKAAPEVSPLLTAGTGKIGVRLSSHPVATSLARALGGGITGTSANLSGKPACRSAQEVLEAFGDALDLILDGGETEGKIGSTILDVTVDPPRILREGMVDREKLETWIKG